MLIIFSESDRVQQQEVYTDEAKMQLKQTVFILALQDEERMVGSNPKPSKEPFGCKKCQGNVRALHDIPFPDHQK